MVTCLVIAGRSLHSVIVPWTAKSMVYGDSAELAATIAVPQRALTGIVQIGDEERCHANASLNCNGAGLPPRSGLSRPQGRLSGRTQGAN